MSNKPQFNLYDELAGKVVALRKTIYPSNKALAVVADLDYKNGHKEVVPISVNLNHGQSIESHNLAEDCFAADVNNRGIIIDSLINDGWLESTGDIVPAVMSITRF